MYVKLLDTQTGKIAEIGEEWHVDSFQLAENNWSCDCNREIACGGGYDWEKPCVSVRYLVIAVSEPDREWYTLRDYNSDYPQELLEKYNISDTSPLDGSEVTPWQDNNPQTPKS